MEYYSGTTRIRNPKTLRRWIRYGNYQELIDDGYIFNPACGRFRETKCVCTKCRNTVNPRLQGVLDEFNL